MRSPTSFDPVNEMKRIFGCVTMRSPISLPDPGNKVHDARRHADLVQEIDEPRRDHRRVARGLQNDGVPRDDCGRRHAHHDGGGEIPRRDDGPDAEGDIDELVALALDRYHGLRLRVAQRFARVELEKVDRLGDVAVGLGPALANLVDEQRVVFETPRAQQLRCLEEVGGALRKRPLPPRLERASGGIDRLVCLLLRCSARQTDNLFGIGRIEGANLPFGFDLPPADHEGVMFAELLLHRGKRRAHGRGVGGVAEILHPFVLEGGYLEVGFCGGRRHGVIVPGVSIAFARGIRSRSDDERAGGLAWFAREQFGMTQLVAVAIAAFFLGIGMAGEPFAPLHALLAISILLLFATALDRRHSPLTVFLFGLVGVLLTCYLQHGEIYPGTGIVGIGLGGLAASSLGRRSAPALVATLGTLVGAGLYFLL